MAVPVAVRVGVRVGVEVGEVVSVGEDVGEEGRLEAVNVGEGDGGNGVGLKTAG